MDKIYIIKYKERFLRTYLSKMEAEKYYCHIKEKLEGAVKVIKEINSYSSKGNQNLQLIALPISQENDDLDMRICGYGHAGGGELAVTYELGEV